ncbi:unnamed protein product [Ilex paraguariensis]|uniref:Uncharacterized protein n=1 Tax=Ilex paraguariensis TaxID=185542 RepID=A0ABC8QTR2_9AQUA
MAGGGENEIEDFLSELPPVEVAAIYAYLMGIREGDDFTDHTHIEDRYWSIQAYFMNLGGLVLSFNGVEEMIRLFQMNEKPPCLLLLSVKEKERLVCFYTSAKQQHDKGETESWKLRITPASIRNPAVTYILKCCKIDFDLRVIVGACYW